VVAAKVVADGTCFLVNFVAMRSYVFRATEGLTRRLRRIVAARPWLA
jgi:putative flippase GtrA